MVRTSRETLIVALLAAAVTLAALYILYRLVDPLPPRRLIMAAGMAESGYDKFAKQYARILERHDVALEIRNSAERIQRAYIAGLGEAEGGERRLHARIGIAQQIDILHRAGRVADFQGDVMTLKYPRVLLRELVIARLRHPSGHDQPARR